VDGGQTIQSLKGHRLPILGLAWSTNGSYLVSGTRDRMPYGSNVVWDVDSGEIVGLSHTDAAGCGAVSWNPDGKSWFESSGWGVASWVAVWDLNNQQYAIPPQERFGCVYDMDFSPDGSKLALGNEDGNIFLWDITSDNSVITLTSQIEGASSVSWNPNGAYVAVAGTDEVVVFDVKNTIPIFTTEGHANVDWSQDGRKLLSSGVGNSIAVWDSASGQLMGRLAGHTNIVTSLAISPDGNQLATGGADRIVRIISTRYLEPPCNWALRNMSLDEWELYFPGETYHRTCPELPDGT
ncbi:WD40 repeat domain-containing protein, partial [Chloroflexota bacterium]